MSQRRTRRQKRVAKPFKRFIKVTGQPVHTLAEIVCLAGAVIVALHKVMPSFPEATAAFEASLACTALATWYLKRRLERHI